ncbi:MAG: response regulator transcription factor [Clostridia bacterium]|nr:response regulator transcription factor [Clostridia bacterium]
MKVAICDDMNEIVLELSEYIEQYFLNHNYNLTLFKFNSGKELLISEEQYDLIFLDVEIGEENGIEVGKILKEKNPNAIIFIVTAYNKYLDDAFDLQVFRFFNKPIEPERLNKALDSAFELINKKIIEFVDCKTNERVKIVQNDIVLAFIDGRKIKIVSTKGENYCNLKLKEFAGLLSASFFASPHASFIVNLNYSTKYQRTEITLTNDKKEYIVPVSAKNQPSFRETYFKFQSGE